jgi:very-short-patch-repair endonuclease
MAAVLACGPQAALSHGSAAALWGIARDPGGQIDISVPFDSFSRPRGIRIHRRYGLRPIDFATECSIPVTTPVRTLLDLAIELDLPELERAVNDADRIGLVNPERLRGALDAYSGERGVGRLRSLLDRRTFRLTRSELERRFLSLVKEGGLPLPLTKQRVNGFEVDFYWPQLELVVETDGLRYHRTPAVQARDRLRDQAHTAAGMTQLRFTHEQVRYEPEHVRAVHGDVARRLGVVEKRVAAP